MESGGSHHIEAISFAHMSDPHLPLPDIADPWFRLQPKQMLGLSSWRRKRHKRHRAEVLAALIADIRTARPGHIAVTGDLVNIAHPSEFEAAKRWLAALGPPCDVTLVPGNHDAYVAARGGPCLDHWQAWMQGDEGDTFPFIRQRGPVAFLGLSTAVAKPPLMATGTLGPDQLGKAEEALARLRDQGAFRVVLIHHPPQNGAAPPRKALTDRHALQDVIARQGAELILHGHLHRQCFAALAGPAGPVPVFGVASCSMRLANPKGDPARWHLFKVQRADQGWMLHARIRGLTADGFKALADWRINIAS